MIELRPCGACQRHFATTEAACPFCAIERTAVASPRPSLTGRVSRAAVFGAAALAAGCDKGTPPKQGLAGSDVAKRDAAVDAASPDAATADPNTFQPMPPYGAPPARRRLV